MLLPFVCPVSRVNDKNVLMTIIIACKTFRKEKNDSTTLPLISVILKYSAVYTVKTIIFAVIIWYLKLRLSIVGHTWIQP